MVGSRGDNDAALVRDAGQVGLTHGGDGVLSARRGRCTTMMMPRDRVMLSCGDRFLLLSWQESRDLAATLGAVHARTGLQDHP